MSPINNHKLGFFGETLAINFLRKTGYKILQRNFKLRNGEIDIVALDKKTLVFIEVKTRKNTFFGLPEETITIWKKKFLIKSANFYKLTHPNLPDEMRIDAIAILLDNNDKIQTLKHYINITD